MAAWRPEVVPRSPPNREGELGANRGSQAAPPLPRLLTTFIGRRQELAAVERCLAAHRLVTLLGPAGGGKTRLALEVAARAHPNHRDGAFLAELAPVAEPNLIAGHVALSVGVHEVAGRSLPGRLSFVQATASGRLGVDGPTDLARAFPTWGGLSCYANVVPARVRSA